MVATVRSSSRSPRTKADIVGLTRNLAPRRNGAGSFGVESGGRRRPSAARERGRRRQIAPRIVSLTCDVSGRSGSRMGLDHLWALPKWCIMNPVDRYQTSGWYAFEARSSSRGPRTLEGALGHGTDGPKPSPPGPRWRTNLGAATADLGPIVLLPAFQMGYFIRSTGHVEPLLLRLDLLGAEDAHQDLGHVAPPSCSPRPRTLERTALAVAGKGRRLWIRVPDLEVPVGHGRACRRLVLGQVGDQRLRRQQQRGHRRRVLQRHPLHLGRGGDAR